jgi:hypothetical protein
VAGAGGAEGDKIVAAHEVGGVVEFFDGISAEDVSGSGIDECHVVLLGGSSAVVLSFDCELLSVPP